MPLPSRPLSAGVVRHNGRLYLFDGGEGVQLSFKIVHLGFKALTVMAVSHLHADHCLGLPGLLMMRARAPEPGPLTVLGPAGIERFIRNVHRDLGFYINYELRFVEWNEGREPLAPAYQDESVTIHWLPMRHTVPCLGYRLEERERPGKFNPERANSLGIPKGVLWGKLQHGEIITLEGGEVIKPDQVLGTGRRGRSIAYITDSRENENIHLLLEGADLAAIEGMFHPRDWKLAQERMHLTAAEAGQLCLRAQVGRAIMVHVSPRYEDSELGELEQEARKIFPGTEMGRPFSSYTIPLLE